MCSCTQNAVVCKCNKPVPHKHAAIIKAWADGAEIQCRASHRCRSEWVSIAQNPAWHDYFEYRIKPEEKSIGQIAMEGWARAAGISYTWLNRNVAEKNQWEAAAQAVRDHLEAK